MKKLFLAMCALIGVCSQAAAEQKDVTLAGFAFAGQYEEAKVRLPYTFKVFETAKNQKNSLSRVILARADQIKNPDIRYLPGELASLKGSQSLMAILTMSGETVSTTCFSTGCKIFVNLRGDATIFDAKNHTIVRNYPLNLNIFDAISTGSPSEEHLVSLIEDALRRTDGNGIISQFNERLVHARLPREGVSSLNLQVGNVEITPEALALLPTNIRADKALSENILADTFSSIFASRLGVPMLPTKTGHAQGTMQTRLENGTDFELKIPKGDYLFDIKLSKFVKVKTGENELGRSFIVGAYVKLRLSSELNDYINTDIKNGENTEELITQKNIDDSPAYQDALRGLFLKVSEAIKEPTGKWGKWLPTSVSAKDMAQQIDKTSTLMKTLRTYP